MTLFLVLPLLHPFLKHVHLTLNLRALMAEVLLLFFEEGDLARGGILAEFLNRLFVDQLLVRDTSWKWRKGVGEGRDGGIYALRSFARLILAGRRLGSRLPRWRQRRRPRCRG